MDVIYQNIIESMLASIIDSSIHPVAIYLVEVMNDSRLESFLEIAGNIAPQYIWNIMRREGYDLNEYPLNAYDFAFNWAANENIWVPEILNFYQSAPLRERFFLLAFTNLLWACAGDPLNFCIFFRLTGFDHLQTHNIINMFFDLINNGSRVYRNFTGDLEIIQIEQTFHFFHLFLEECSKVNNLLLDHPGVEEVIRSYRMAYITKGVLTLVSGASIVFLTSLYFSNPEIIFELLIYAFYPMTSVPDFLYSEQILTIFVWLLYMFGPNYFSSFFWPG